MQFFTSESLGTKQHLTPEGYLLCQDVPISRVGTLVYQAHELTGGPTDDELIPDSDGLIYVDRAPEDVFDPQSIASGQGKPITNDHPNGFFIDPSTWRTHAVGTVLNVRQGLDAYADVLMGDLMVTDPQAIVDIRNGKRQVSAGYEAEYLQTAPGRARQFDIRLNHVALVDEGRCGLRCAIGDHKPPTTKDTKMPKVSLWDRIRTAVKTGDADMAEKAIKDAKDAMTGEGDDDAMKKDVPDIHVHVNTPDPNATNDKRAKSKDDMPANGTGLDPDSGDNVMEQRMSALEVAVAQLLSRFDSDTGNIDARMKDKKAKDGDDKDKDKDKDKDEADDLGSRWGKPDNKVSADEAIMGELEMQTPPGADVPKKGGVMDANTVRERLTTLATDTRSRAEILVPGMTMPTMDAAGDRAKFGIQLCGFRRQVLTATTGDTADIVAKLAPTTIQKMSCDQVRTTFISASEVVRHANNNKLFVGTPSAARTREQNALERRQALNEKSRR